MTNKVTFDIKHQKVFYILPDLVDTLEKETGVALSWLKQNEMIANPE